VPTPPHDAGEGVLIGLKAVMAKYDVALEVRNDREDEYVTQEIALRDYGYRGGRD
jgi:hypothetical protein